jgi:hypothetical protein
MRKFMNYKAYEYGFIPGINKAPCGPVSRAISRTSGKDKYTEAVSNSIETARIEKIGMRIRDIQLKIDIKRNLESFSNKL